MNGRAIAALATGLLAASAAQAHEFWVEPSSFRPAAGERVSFRLLVGDGFPGEGYARNPRHVVRFELLGPEGVRPIPGEPGEDPAGRAAYARGREVAVYQSADTKIELEAERFEHYLMEVGLERIVALRAERGQALTPGRELFSRSAKTVVGGGAGEATGFDRVAGLALELVPEEDPLDLLPGDVLPIRVLFEGQPRPGILLRAFHRDRAGERARARTDGAGRAELVLDSQGMWMISAVHMVAAHEGAGADWRSLWASLTLSIEP